MRCAGSTQQHWPFPEHRIPLGYAYLFTHPGNPTIFWDHYFDSHHRDVLDQLIALRKRNGLNAKSSVEILAADHDFYVARIDDKCVVLPPFVRHFLQQCQRIVSRRAAVQLSGMCMRKLQHQHEAATSCLRCCASFRVTIKLGPRYDMGDKLPNEHEGWTFALGGEDFGIWEKK